MARTLYIEQQPQSIRHYFTIWGVLLVLFIISVTVAQLSDNRALVLVTVFGVATFQAFLVATYYMHLEAKQTHIAYLMLAIFFALVLVYANAQADAGIPSESLGQTVDTTQLTDEHKEQVARIGHAQVRPTGEHGL
jgi:caa(3)-type oxidase subunit IV